MINQPHNLYKSYVTKKLSLIFLSLLLVVLSAMRIVGALGEPSVGWLLPLGFVLMMLLPWVLLTQEGRRKIGLKKPSTLSSYLLGIGMGVGSAFLCFLFGYLLFGTAPDNWFVNIGNTFKASMDTSATTKTVTFKKDKRIPQRRDNCTYQLTEFLWNMTYLAFRLQKIRSN